MESSMEFARSCEAAAARHLEQRGWRIVARNFRTRRGEIDIIASRGPILAFVEVKGKRGTAYGSPAEMLTLPKRRRIVGAAIEYLQEHRVRRSSCRFDLVAVTAADGGRLSLEHIPGVFDLGDAREGRCWPS